MSKIVHIVLIAFMLALTTNLWSQGCSDPGLCTIGVLNTEVSKDTTSPVDFVEESFENLLKVPIADEKYRFELGSAYSRGQNKINIYSVILRGVFRIKEKMLLTLKVPYIQYQGELGNTGGVGDFAVSLQNTIFSGKDKRVSYTLAMVLPSGDASKTLDGKILPMAYQTTLGAYNGVIGIAAAHKTWSTSLGYQHSFGTNGNTFDPTVLSLDTASADYDELNEERQHYAPGINLKRGSDLAFRVEKRFNASHRLSFAVGALAIYRLQKSRVDIASGRTSLDNSEGLTINHTAGMRYVLKKNWVLRANVGVPSIQRAVMADGLKRKFVGILSVGYRIW